MNNNSILRIDWNEPFDKITPFLERQGGVVLVSGYLTSACNSFAKLVRQNIRAQNSENICLLFNYEDENTHSPADIIAKLESKLGIGLSALSSGSVRILENNEAGGNISTGNIYYNNEPDPYEKTRNNYQRIKNITQAIDNVLQTNRFAIILYGYEKMLSSTISWFWNHLWVDNLEELCDKGLLVICFYETPDGNDSCRDSMPQLNRVIALPPVYDSIDRFQILDEVTHFFIHFQNKDSVAARAKAESLLEDCQYRPSVIHSRLKAYLQFGL